MLESVLSAHMLFAYGIVAEQYFWCEKCGAFTSRWPRALRMPCKGHPTSASQEQRRGRMANGLLPFAAAYLEDASADSVVRKRKIAALPQASDASSGYASDGLVNCRKSSKACGRYLRLPGGPLYRQHLPRSVDSGAASSIASDGCRLNDTVVGSISNPRPADRPAVDWRPRRRITLKSTVAAARRSENCCHPLGPAGWAGRLKAIASEGHGSCHRCGGRTRTECRGCRRSLCVECAKAVLPCRPKR